MRLIIIADESVYEHEVDPSVEVQDVIALIEAETGMSSDRILLTTDDGTPLIAPKRSLESYGLKGADATIYLTSPPQAGSSQLPAATGGRSEDDEYERMRLQMLGDPQVMSQIQQAFPDLFRAVHSGTSDFKAAVLRQRSGMQASTAEKDRQVELLNSDPYDIEAQKKIEEAIRREQVTENMEHAWEHAPETFGDVTMLYINVEVNGQKVKAFVDSGAQRTIISPACAEKCGIMRLLDDRFAGVAVGVGTGKILGRIHSAQIKLGELYFPCSFTVLDGNSVDLLFGLDMLKRYQCSIDLGANVLRVQNTEVPFLPEHELPKNELQREIQAAQHASDAQAGSSSGSSKSTSASAGAGPSTFPGSGNVIGSTPSAIVAPKVGKSSTAVPTGAVDAGRAGTVNENDIQTLMGLGAERQQAISLLEASGGNVDYAASMLFGGGAQWP